jgi:hypothetical protein
MAGDNLVNAVRASSQRLGINPSDLLTAMSYETGGKLDPNLWGGAGGRYLGLIQFGPEEQRTYGVKPGMSVGDQVNAAEDFLRDRGVKPGMGLLDIYSTINAGRPGLYDRSDASNGGAPGTVADKVATQMVGHRARANAMLYGSGGGDDDQTLPASGDASSTVPSTTTSMAPADVGVPAGPRDPDAGITSSMTSTTAPTDNVLSAIGRQTGNRQPGGVAAPLIDTPQPAGLPAAQKLAAIMMRLQLGTQNGSQ